MPAKGNKGLWAIVIVLVVAVAGFLLLNRLNNASTTAENNQNTEKNVDLENLENSGQNNVLNQNTADTGAEESGENNQDTPTNGGQTSNETSAKSFTVTATNFSFDIKEIKVSKGDAITITLNNTEGFHDWNIDEFNARTQKLNQGASETITFIADKTGTFEYYCSIGSHRAMGMKGSLVVEE